MRKTDLMAALAAACLLVGCGGPYSSPEATVKTFLEACSSGDRQAVIDCLESKDRALLEDMMSHGRGGQLTPAPGFDYSVGNTWKQGDEATVTVRVRVKGVEKTETMKLVKEGQDWMLDLIPDELVPAVEKMGQVVGSFQHEMESNMETTLKEMEAALEDTVGRDR